MATAMRRSAGHGRTHTATCRWNASAVVVLVFVASCSWNLQCLDVCLVLAGPAFVPPSRPWTGTRWSLASLSAGRSTKRSRNERPSKPKKKSQKSPSMDTNNPRSIDMDNLLSSMGLQQVNATTAAGAATKNSRKRKNQKKASGTSLKFPEISLRTQLDYARNGHGVLRNFITDDQRLVNLRTELLDLARDQELKAWVQKVQVAAGSQSYNQKDLAEACKSIQGCQKALHDMGVTASLPFLQYFNTWRKLPSVQDLALELGQAASILLDVPKVRLYQDAVFWKRRQDGPTPWHADARMAPFDTQHMITFWIPLQNVPSPREGGTALIFCSKSHSDFALPYWNPPEEDGPSAWDNLEDRYPKKVIDYMPMSLGDVTVHSGWTLHCSNGNELEGCKDRVALAISFVDGDAEIRPDWETIGDDEDRWSYQDWCREVRPRTKFSHPLVPIVWPPSQRDGTN